MRVARLRHRVTIQKPVTTKDASGGVVTTWESAFSGTIEEGVYTDPGQAGAYTETLDAGALAPTSARPSTVWAAIEPLSGQQYFAAKQTMSEVTHRVTMRYLSGVLSTMRLSFSGRYFSIVSVINLDERNRYLVLMVTEAVAP